MKFFYAGTILGEEKKQKGSEKSAALCRIGINSERNSNWIKKRKGVAGYT